MQSVNSLCFFVGVYMNDGKKFENMFKKSVPDFCILERLKDPPQAQNHTYYSTFSWKNKCDFFMFDTLNRKFWCLELKSTKQKYISFEDIYSDKEQNKMIHKHQILGLLDYSKYENVNSGFLFNFRDEKNNEERTYYQSIVDFKKMIDCIGKSSFTEIELILNKAIKVDGKKLRVNYAWDIRKLIDDVENR